MVTNKRIGVLAGGTSAEREVSLKSGNAVLKALTGLGYDAVFIDAAGNICEKITENKIEAVFIALHGGHGENGSVQGLLDIMGIPYTGSGVLASAIAMDKEASKKIFLYHGINIPRFEIFSKGDMPLKKENIEMPCVVKPAAEGSSIGVNIVKTLDGLDAAVDEAFKYGDKIIIEEYIKGKEIQIGIVGTMAVGGVEVRPSLEFYNYEAKYTPGMTQYILPPEIDDALYEKLKAMALKAHEALGCEGATRVDLIVDEGGTAYVLEVNTIPGLTETSLLPKIAKLSGMDFTTLIEEMLKLALKGKQ
jgi:D-alanine-D-alanine ligase